MGEDESLRALTVFEIESVLDFKNKLKTINRYVENKHIFYIVVDQLIFNFVHYGGKYSLMLTDIEPSEFTQLIVNKDDRWKDLRLNLENINIVEELYKTIELYYRYRSLNILI